MIPRLMTKAEAAAHCSLKPTGFAEWVKAGKLPGPLDGTRRWDRVAIDAALDRLSGLCPIKSDETPKSALDRFRESRHARKSAGR